jgi:GT2 family glycosyltransferase
MGISLGVPVICRKFLKDMLTSVQANTVLPDEVVIIDNGVSLNQSVEDICEQFSERLNIRYLPQAKNLMVNPSWDLIVSESRHEICCIWNDDILVSDSIFEKIQITFDSLPLAGFVVPANVSGPNAVLHGDRSLPLLRRLENREGWCMALRKELLKPIPSQLKVFFADDWYAKNVRDAGYWMLRIQNASVYHRVGVSGNLQMRKDLNLPPIENEKQVWNQISTGRLQ